ncbi:MAG: 30S ribosomal protein S20 [Thermogutta sp.]
MPNTKSAKKRLRQNIKRRLHNRSIKRSLRTQARKVREAAAARDFARAEEEFRKACKLLDRAAVKRVIHPNAASRTKSRLAAHIRKFRQTAVEAAAGG